MCHTHLHVQVTAARFVKWILVLVIGYHDVSTMLYQELGSAAIFTPAKKALYRMT